jgi:hypothetical protein
MSKASTPTNTTAGAADDANAWQPAMGKRRVKKKVRRRVAAGRGTRADFVDVYGAQARAAVDVAPVAAYLVSH